jgi:hypothetical protein
MAVGIKVSQGIFSNMYICEKKNFIGTRYMFLGWWTFKFWFATRTLPPFYPPLKKG